MSSTLVVSPNAAERAAYSDWLRDAGFTVAEAKSTADAIARHRRDTFAVTVADMASSVSAAIELIETVRDINPEAELLMLSSGNSVDEAVAAMKAGAVDLLLKPVDRDALLESVRRISSLHEVLEENRRLRRELHRRYDFSHIIGRSKAMLHLLTLAGRVAPRDTAVLITGESGTGKELLARALHVNSKRSHRPLVSINCAAIPETLLESELFGFRRGAFTGAHADKPGLLTTAQGGSLFLDEIAELPLSTQAKLLRFLQEGTYFALGSLQPIQADVRIIAATNAPLFERAKLGSFRLDLYYRLSVFPLHIPPLRDRREDIVPLAHHFLHQIAENIGKKVPGFSREAIEYLTARNWPGNARELQNAVERAVIVSEGNLLTSADFRVLAAEIAVSGVGGSGWQLPDEGINLSQLNRDMVRQALERQNHNVSAAARLLGLTRPALRYRMKKYGMLTRRLPMRKSA